MEGIFNSIDAISKEAIKILNQEDPPSSNQQNNSAGSGSSRQSNSSASITEEDHMQIQVLENLQLSNDFFLTVVFSYFFSFLLMKTFAKLK